MKYIYFIKEVVLFVIRNKYINYIYFSKTKSCHLVLEININYIYFYETISYCLTFEMKINYIYLYEKISYCLILDRIVENNKRIESIKALPKIISKLSFCDVVKCRRYFVFVLTKDYLNSDVLFYNKNASYLWIFSKNGQSFLLFLDAPDNTSCLYFYQNLINFQ
ncbi:hypothetical protein Hanom_Chr04g00344521 [Helianthus anomalus]